MYTSRHCMSRIPRHASPGWPGWRHRGEQAREPTSARLFIGAKCDGCMRSLPGPLVTVYRRPFSPAGPGMLRDPNFRVGRHPILCFCRHSHLLLPLRLEFNSPPLVSHTLEHCTSKDNLLALQSLRMDARPARPSGTIDKAIG